MAKIPNRRRQLFIDELQVRLLSINVAYFAAILVIFAVSLFAPLVVQLLGAEGPEWQQQLVAEQFLYLSETIWLPLLFTFVALGAHSVLVSHRIAGPLYHLRRVLRGVANGNFTTRAVLREKDYLKKEEQVVNEMIDQLGGLIEDVDGQAYELRKTLQQLRTALNTGSMQDALTHLQLVDKNAETLDASLSRFKTRPEDLAPQPAAGA